MKKGNIINFILKYTQFLNLFRLAVMLTDILKSKFLKNEMANQQIIALAVIFFLCIPRVVLLCKKYYRHELNISKKKLLSLISDYKMNHNTEVQNEIIFCEEVENRKNESSYTVIVTKCDFVGKIVNKNFFILISPLEGLRNLLLYFFSFFFSTISY